MKERKVLQRAELDGMPEQGAWAASPQAEDKGLGESGVGARGHRRGDRCCRLGLPPLTCCLAWLLVPSS